MSLHKESIGIFYLSLLCEMELIIKESKLMPFLHRKRSEGQNDIPGEKM